MKQETSKGQREKPIAVYDSGIGGLPYLGWLQKQLPEERFVYLADHSNFPYGEKSIEELREIIPASVQRVIAAADPKLVLIACNTASVIALEELRKRFGIPFVGVVPAIKPAAEQSQRGVIGVFATRRTIEDPYTDNLVRQFAGGCRVVRYAEGRIVNLVEKSFFSTGPEERKSLLRPAAEFFLREGVDYLVLACTHFVFLKNELQEMLERRVKVIDSRDGVGRQVLRILDREGLRRSSHAGGETRGPGAAARPVEGSGGAEAEGDPVPPPQNRFFITGEGDQEAYRSFAASFDLEWGGIV